MQQVEHKRRRSLRSTKRRILAGCIVLLITGGVLLGIVRPWDRKPAAVEPSPSFAGSLTKREAEEVESITVIRRGKQPWTLEKNETGELRIRGSEKEPGNVVTDLIRDAMANIVYEDILTEDPAEYRDALADFGLADPMITATARYTDGTEVTVRIGDACGLEEETFHYMTVDGDDRLFAVGYGTVEDLDFDEPLLYAVEQPVLNKVLLDRIAVYDGEGNMTAGWELQGKVTDADAEENWRIIVPFEYPMDYDTVVSMKNCVGQLTLGTLVGPAEGETLAGCGFETPRAEIRLHFAAGNTGTVSELGVYDVQEWEEKEVRFVIGGKRNEMTDYVLWEDGIYTVSQFLIEPLTDADPMETAAKYPVLTPLEALSSLTVETAGETVTYQSDTETGEDGTETRKYLRNGQEIDRDVFEAAYERLLTVNVSGKLPEDYEKQETYKKYTFRTVSGGTHTVELSPWDPFQDAVTVDGYTLFYLVRGSMTDLP